MVEQAENRYLTHPHVSTEAEAGNHALAGESWSWYTIPG